MCRLTYRYRCDAATRQASSYKGRRHDRVTISLKIARLWLWLWLWLLLWLLLYLPLFPEAERRRCAVGIPAWMPG